MKILILTDNVVEARNLTTQLNLDNPLVWDESIVNEGVQIHPADITYTSLTVKRTANLVTNYKAKRPLVIILDMLRWSAVEQITHDFSILLYNDSKKRKLGYNVQYRTDFTLKSSNDIEKITAITASLQNFN
jgi:hypothetical protein